MSDANIQSAAHGFFAIDRGAFRCAVAGGLNTAIAHLIMARGTGRDNRTTQWSVHAIKQRTGISRPNAAKAVKELTDRGIWKKTRDGKHPIYETVPGNQIPGGPFTAHELEAIAEIRDGKEVPYETYEGSAAIKALVAKGIVKDKRKKQKTWGPAELNDVAIAALTEPLAVWLPNALIDGASDEVPPIELIRQTRGLPALSLLIELYAVQFLPNYGGVPRELLRNVFERTKVGEQGPFVVWGFRSATMTATRDLARPFMTGQFTQYDDGRYDAGWRTSFWPAVHTLVDLGLVERVGMLLDGDDSEAEIIHPYAIEAGEPAERELAAAAQQAAETMVTPGQLDWARREGYRHLAPVLKHMSKATLVEVFRLKYRPHTTATSAWFGLMMQGAAEYLAKYRALIDGAGSAQNVENFRAKSG